MNSVFKRILACVLAACTITVARQQPSSRAQMNAVLLSTMKQELDRATGELKKHDPAPYFLSYSVYDQQVALAVAAQGSLITSTRLRHRAADVIMRVGAPALDNTHEENRVSALSSGALPLADDPDAIARVLWRLTYGEYRKASRAYLNVKTKMQVNAQEEDQSPDFSEEPAQQRADSTPLPASADQARLEAMVRRYSALLSKYPEIYSSYAIVSEQITRLHFVSSEGTQVVIPSATVRLAIEAETRAEDGMELLRFETFQSESLDHLLAESEITARVAKMATDLKALRAAPLAEPYNGPALLSGRAAAVFFHEVLGHRIEGHRQRGENEGQTFTKKVDELVLPEFLSVTDDPTQRQLNGTDLSGWYTYDDEGMPARRVEVVKNGVLKTFLMSRIPVKNFSKSNGHGRSQPGAMPVGRQGNLIVTSSNSTPNGQMRQKLIDEVKKQGKPYGLYFEDIQGGFTLTQRAAPQSFQILPVMVWRVYADGRPDELVRGVDIVGTPLATMNRILITGDQTEVFNGMCGAESGTVPVGAASPAILFSEMEVQKRAHSLNRPPILPPPGFESDGVPAKKGGQP